jgi:ribonuclease VapC
MQLVVDSSILIALLLGEPERDAFHWALLGSEPVMSIANLTEATLVARHRKGERAVAEVDLYVATYRIRVEPVTTEDFPLLRQALLDFGKGRRRPPAVLNFGDLFAYALARRLKLPLLYKGEDFARTDVEAVRL